MVPDELLKKIKEMVALNLGLDFFSSRDYDIEKGLIGLGREHGVKAGDQVALVNWLESTEWTREKLDNLARYLTVGETFFFREKPHLEVFREVMIPELLNLSHRTGMPVTIWSAGCCTGEEPYTLAMILREVLHEQQLRHFAIVGSDINHQFLHAAQQGNYRIWSFRETPDETRQRFFVKTGDTWSIRDEVKKMVTFRYFNLVGAYNMTFPSGGEMADVIFCRNVLMYFTHEQFLKVTGRFFRTLNLDGFLIPGTVEVNDAEFSEFEPVSFSNCTVYRKSRKKPMNRSHKAIPSSEAPPAPLIRSPRTKAVKKTAVPSRSIRPVQVRIAEPGAQTHDPSKIFDSADYRKCIEICEEMLRRDAGNIFLLSWIVRSYANLGNLAEAGRWATIMLETPGAEAGHFYLAATVNAEMDDHSGAASLLKKGLYLDPRHLPSHFLLGRVAGKLGRADLSKRHYINALDLLEPYREEEPVPQVEGLNAGRMRELIKKSIALL